MVDCVLYHYPLCPFSRKVRFVLNEFGFTYKLKEVKFWKRNVELLKLNPLNEIPVLIDQENDAVIIDSFVIAEYLDAKYNKESNSLLKLSFLSQDEVQKAEIRRLEMWFDKKFYNEVSKYILEEKVYNTFLDNAVNINTKRLKAGQKNLDNHIRYMEYLLDNRKWLAGEEFTIADISAATQISSLDYLGEISWNKYSLLKDWYSTIKSKTSFRSILNDKIEGFAPSKYYTELDFD